MGTSVSKLGYKDNDTSGDGGFVSRGSKTAGLDLGHRLLGDQSRILAWGLPFNC